MQVLDVVPMRRHLMKRQILEHLPAVMSLSAVSSFGHDVVPVLPIAQLPISKSSFAPPTSPSVPG